jgi:ABC-type multidrug transport system ATPase subunit
VRSERPIVRFEGYGKKGVIAPFSLSVAPGEIVGLAGLLGSGRTETAEVMFGIRPADSGECQVCGKVVSIRSARKASANGFGFCPEDRKLDGIIASASVRENIILALQAQRGWLHPIPRREQEEISARFIQQLAIKTPSAEQPIGLLSGGNQQKVLLARWLLTKPQFLILDEPTRGIDVGAHAEIIRLIETLCANGLALLVISSELEELVGYADRVIVLRDRRQVAELETQELSVPAIMNAIANEAYPDLELLLREDTTTNLLKQLEQGQLDLLILALPVEIGGFHSKTVGQDPFHMVMPSHMAAGLHMPFDYKELPNQSIFLLEREHCLTEHAVSACRLRDKSKINPFAATSLHTLVQMVGAGLGTTFLPQMAIDAGILDNTDLVAIPLPGEKPYREIGLVWRPSTTRVQTFYKIAELLTPLITPKPAG